MDNNILGVVLCGGMSTRMGQDKGLLKRRGKFWAEIIAEKFSKLGIEYVYSINSVQEKIYQSSLGEDKNFVIDSIEPYQGPFKGLMSVHEKYPNKDLFLIACDMPLFNKKRIERLKKANVKNAMGFNYGYILNDSGFCEPFGALYNAKALSKINPSDKLSKNLSLQKILNHGISSFFLTKDAKSFTNYNIPL